MKKIIKYSGITLLVLFILLLAAPLLFKKQIVRQVKKAANEQLNAVIDFDDDIRFGFIRNFPNANLGIKNLSVIGRDPFEGDTLAYADQLNIVIDLKSLFGDEGYRIRDVRLEKPYVQLLVDTSGHVNWDIMKPDETETELAAAETTSFKAALQQYSIQDGRLIYSDRGLGFYMEADHLDHTGKGDFTQDIFNLSTTSRARALTIAYSGIPWLNRLETDLDADIHIDMNQYKYSFTGGEARFNGLNLGVEGWVAMPGDDIDLDIAFEAPEADFKNLLSLIPAIYQKDFESLQASGTANIEGRVQGIYNDDRMPGFDFNLTVRDGRFQYPSVPEALSDVNMNIAVANEDGDMDHTTIEVSRLHFQMGSNPFDARLLVHHPVSDPLIDGEVTGKLNLDDVSKIYPLEEGTKIGGLLDMDIGVKGRLSAMEAKKFDDFQTRGHVKADNVVYQTPSLEQNVTVHQGELQFTPQRINLRQLAVNIGKSDLQADGSLDNLFGYLFGKDNLQGTLDFRSSLLDVNEMMGAAAVTESVPADSVGAVEAIVLPRNIDFSLNTRIDRFFYDNLDLKNIRGNVTVRDGVLALQGAQADLLQGTTRLSGTYDSRNPETPKADFSFQADKIDIRSAFETFNTVKILAPIAEFVQGSFSGDISLSTLLNKNLFPQLTSLNSLGKIDIPDLKIKGFEPIQQLASTLGIATLKEWDLQKLFLQFKVDDGYLHVQPFDFAVQGIKMNVAGKNGLNKDIDYTLDLEIPRKMLGNADNALTRLVDQANQLTKEKIELGETVKTQVRLGGTITQPKVSLDLSEEKARIEQTIKNTVRDEAKDQIRQGTDKLLDQLLKGKTPPDSTVAADSTLTEKKEKEDKKEEVKDAIKEGLKGLLNRKKD